MTTTPKMVPNHYSQRDPGGPISLSFSGGRTSAYMAYLLLKYLPRERLNFIFMNTGFEARETLEFIRQVDAALEMNLVCIEPVISEKKGVGPSYVQVNIADLKAESGEFFEAMCAKYGVPNRSRPFCTRVLKTDPLRAYLRDRYGKNRVKQPRSAVGLRVDEIDRLPHPDTAERDRLIYPLTWGFPEHPEGVTKQDVLDFWQARPFGFDLEIPEHMGNCLTCWKKSERKLAKVYRDRPAAFAEFQKCEQYSHVTGKLPGPHHFYKAHRSTQEIVHLFETKYIDVLDDTPDGCSDHCEPFGDDNIAEPLPDFLL